MPAKTNELLAMRAIGLQQSFCESIRDILEKQLNHYDNASEVDKNISIALNKYSNDKMMQNSKMIRL